MASFIHKHNRGILFAFVLNIIFLGFSNYYLDNFFSWNDPIILEPLSSSESARFWHYFAFAQIVSIGILVVQCHEFIIYKRNSLSIVLVPSLAVKIINTIIYFLAVVIAIKLVFHQSLGAILAASGVLGLVLGFALRGLVSDLFSGIAMSLDGNIRANDWLFFNLKGTHIKAKLVEFNWRAARFIDEDNNLILVPNSELSTLMVINYSRPNPILQHTAQINLDINYDTSQVLRILKNSLSKAIKDKIILDTPAPSVLLTKLSEKSSTYDFVFSMPPNKGKNLGVDAVIKNCLDFLKFSNIYVNNHSTHPEINNLKDLTIQQKNIINTLYNSLFSKLNINELYEMSLKVNYAHYSQSDHLIKRGDSDTNMMIMCTGNADVVIHVDGNPLTVNSLWPGDYFGEMSLFTGEPRSADIIATSETKVIVITKEAIAGILESNHSLVTEIANMISSRLKLNESNREQLANASNKDSGSKPNFLVGLIKNFFNL